MDDEMSTAWIMGMFIFKAVCPDGGYGVVLTVEIRLTFGPFV